MRCLFENYDIEKQGWLQPYKAPCIVESGSCAITTVLSPNAFFHFFKNLLKNILTDRCTKKESDIESSKVNPTIKTIYGCRHRLNSTFFAFFAFF